MHKDLDNLDIATHHFISKQRDDLIEIRLPEASIFFKEHFEIIGEKPLEAKEVTYLLQRRQTNLYYFSGYQMFRPFYANKTTAETIQTYLSRKNKAVNSHSAYVK